jgi:hypothetical protein
MSFINSTSATVYEELAMFTAVSASSSRVGSPGAPGCRIGTFDMLTDGINRPLKKMIRAVVESNLKR